MVKMFHKFDFVTRMQSNPWYALCLLLLALLGFCLLIYEFTPWAKAEVIEATMKVDLVIAWIFLLDFFLGLLFNQKYTYREYWRQNWLDFISSIPISADMARALRILRVFRALRVISSALDIYFTRRRYRSLKK
jgi:hypothetical protein